MGRKNNKNRLVQQAHNKPETNFVAKAGPGCYIARRDLTPSFVIEWEDVDKEDFEGDEVPDIALDVDENTLSLCNVEGYTQIAYITVYETVVRGQSGQVLTPGTTTDNQGRINSCVTFIVLCPPKVFVHLCYLDHEDITQVRIESDVREWIKHPTPSDEHPQRLGFPLAGGPFLCTQGENGELTHFFSGNLHAIDFACPVGTPLLAVADGNVVESTDANTLSGISVTNLFKWNSIILKLDSKMDNKSATDAGGPLFVEYVHIQSSCVKVGDRITQGQIIGTSGSVGFSPEPHLHFSAFRSSEPEAPTVRVRFESAASSVADNKAAFLPIAGSWYDNTGPVVA
jgi:hypothetical protein